MTTYQQNMERARKHLTNAYKCLHSALALNAATVVFGDDVVECRKKAKVEFARAKGIAKAASVCKFRAKGGGHPDQPVR